MLIIEVRGQGMIVKDLMEMMAFHKAKIGKKKIEP